MPDTIIDIMSEGIKLYIVILIMNKYICNECDIQCYAHIAIECQMIVKELAVNMNVELLDLTLEISLVQNIKINHKNLLRLYGEQYPLPEKA